MENTANLYICTRRDGSYGIYRDIPGVPCSREGVSFPAGLPAAQGVKRFLEAFTCEGATFSYVYENEWDLSYKSYGPVFPPQKDTEVVRIKNDYPEGTRLRLSLPMLDPNPVPVGTEGEVSFVDDAGQIHMVWDNGRTLPLNVLVDVFEIIGNNPVGRD